MKASLGIGLAAVLCVVEIHSQLLQFVPPKREVRAVWITTAGGADWPNSYSPAEQRKSLIRIFESLRLRNFNTIFLQVRPRGNTFYKSVYEPWSAELTGTLGKDPGWDPLEFAVEQAHRRGMELHAWFNVAKVYQGDLPPLSSPRHIVRRHPEWVRMYEAEWWIDMGRPEVRQYTEDLVMELVRSYDIDGIHFDYIRYPGESYNDWQTFRLRGEGVERDEWRRNNITEFVRDVYSKIIAEKPMLKVGSAPLGIYKPISGAQSGFSGYSGLYQDARRWLKERIHDYVVPQLYWDFGEQTSPNDPDFRALCIDWMQNAYERQVIAGIGAYRENVRHEIGEQILLTRYVGMQGQSFFRYDNIVDLPAIDANYRYPALIPPMPWKDSVPPLPPTDVRVSDPEGNVRVIRWSPPQAAADGDTAYKYVIYRSKNRDVDTSNSRNILAVVPAPQTLYIDVIPDQGGSQLSYTVSTLDRGNNESIAGVSTFASDDASRADLLPPHPMLAQNYPNPFSDRTYISYELSEKGPVELILRDSASTMEITLVKGTQDPGTYIVSIEAKNLSRGKYFYQLKAGTFMETKYMVREQ